MNTRIPAVSIGGGVTALLAGAILIGGHAYGLRNQSRLPYLLVEFGVLLVVAGVVHGWLVPREDPDDRA